MFYHSIPKCDSRGLLVGITWQNKEVKLYLNGKLIEVNESRKCQAIVIKD
jgi:hypothetical protein